MNTVTWHSTTATKAEVWRILDLSGLTNNVRQSRNYTKAGYAFVNGNKVANLKTTVAVGSIFTLELRFPSGKIKSKEIFLTSRPPRHRARQTGPSTGHYNG